MSSSIDELNSDELGELAQKEFERLATSSRLVVNDSSGRDRTGWDYRVEFPTTKLKQDVVLDKRQVPPPIMVQVKGIKKGTKSVKVNLRTLERFAKLSEPSILFILEFEEPDRLYKAYYIHLLNDALSVVLKRLTKISVKNNKLSAQETLTFSKSKYWNAFEASALGIKSLLDNQIIEGLSVCSGMIG